MKRTSAIVFSAVLVLVLSTLAAAAPEPGPSGAGSPMLQWARMYGGGDHLGDSYYDVAVGSDNNPVAVGDSEYPGSLSGFMIAKYSGTDGSVMWRKITHTGLEYCVLRSVAVGADGNPVAAGVYNSGDDDIWVRKYDGNSGATLWTKTFGGGEGNDRANGVAIAGDGNPVVVGCTWSAGRSLVWVRKYGSSDGAIIWSMTYAPGSPGSVGCSLCFDGEGHFYLCGSHDDAGSSAAFVAKFNDGASPVFQWKKSSGGSGVPSMYEDVALDGKGTVVVTGTFNIHSNWYLNTVGYRCSDGWPMWNDNYLGSYDEIRGMGVACDASGNTFVSAEARELGDQWAWIRKYDATGKTGWTTLYQNDYYSSQAYRLSCDAGGNLFVACITDTEDELIDALLLKYIAASPAVTAVSPTSGPPGATVTVKGSNFGLARTSSSSGGAAGSYVAFNGVQATGYDSWSNTQIKCVVPPGATSGPVVVTTSVGASNDDIEFKVTKPSWYLAEGSTAWGFNTYITIENPSGSNVNAAITYMTADGPVDGGVVGLPAESQTTVDPRAVLGDRDFSTFVNCEQGSTIAVDRTMTWTGTGAPSAEAHNSIGVTAPAEQWYLAEGSSAWGFECWLLIQNPGDHEATCQVTYMIEGAAPVTKEKKVPANSRATFNMESDIGQHDASIMVRADRPVIPERAMYRNSRREGHESIGTLAAANDYYLAEGTTAWGFTTYVLVQNPNDSDNKIDVTFMTPQGPVALPRFTMPANSRKTIRVNDHLPGTDLSTKVHGSLPVIAERAMYWYGGGVGELGEACHDSIGMASPHTRFYFPDGQAGDGYETWTLVQNHNSADVEIEVSYLPAGGADKVSFKDTVPAQSRKTYSMGQSGIGGRAAVKVRSLTAGRKIMCERAMYWNSRGTGTDTIGGYVD